LNYIDFSTKALIEKRTNFDLERRAVVSVSKVCDVVFMACCTSTLSILEVGTMAGEGEVVEVSIAEGVRII
jgi:hypothetical protein